MNPLDAKDLKVFETVVRCESMKRAAVELNTVQSNVTARIRHLEEELGALLFERRPNGMAVTPTGERLLPYAYEVLAAIANAKRAVNEMGEPSGTLLIGSRKSTSAVHLIPILSRYLGAYSKVDVRVRTETSPLLMAAVLERRLEAAFVCDPVEHRDLIAELIFDEELVILTTPQIASFDALDRSAIRIIVLGQGSNYEQQLKAVLAQRGCSIAAMIELGTVENILDAVNLGLGITLLPQSLAAVAVRAGRVQAHKVTEEDCRVQTLFIRRKDAFVSSALGAFLGCARAYASELKKART